MKTFDKLPAIASAKAGIQEERHLLDRLLAVRTVTVPRPRRFIRRLSRMIGPLILQGLRLGGGFFYGLATMLLGHVVSIDLHTSWTGKR